MYEKLKTHACVCVCVRANAVCVQMEAELRCSGPGPDRTKGGMKAADQRQWRKRTSVPAGALLICS